MASKLNPYLGFDGNTREAMEFYRDVFGSDLEMMTWEQAGIPGDNPDGIMHAELETPDGFVLMASDTAPGQPYTPSTTMIALSGDDESLRDYFVRLAEGGRVDMPLEPQSWGAEFGMVTDRYGIPWGVNLSSGQQG